ncbi:hypothetical protein GJ744_000435 [Endocarpon pusillum]|uniref:Transcriptional coactivator p15 (PC4) C-terminal domain-containing protein n=1 Tax=Endocarpon pusillum TaxID=364733 RepID=A0A8H7E070_9EURO|nr:hypothetical protein GJ744_000435 [Endocarpon pusillum]
MAPPRTQKRKPGPQTYESDDGFIANDSETSDRPNKRSKTSKSQSRSTHFSTPGQSQVDSEGNQYWEISRMRRVTISEFKGKRMVNIREFYEKDGQVLPGKKGISMTVEQYSALVDIMPQLEKALEEKGEHIPRPKYDISVSDADAPAQTEEDDDGSEAQPQRVEIKVTNAKRKKANIEATSDEEEADD